MRIFIRIIMIVFAISSAWQGATIAAIIEVGDLNVINDPGNPSDGLSYLDMAFSDGLSQAAALANAQASYADARLATPAEFDDLFDAAGIAYNGALTASDAFSIGVNTTISNGVNYDGGALAAQLGFTTTNISWIWSDPDGNADTGTTRDYLVLEGAPIANESARIFNVFTSPPNSSIGWLIVSETAAVPIPGAVWLLGSGLIGIVVLRRKFKKKPYSEI